MLPTLWIENALEYLDAPGEWTVDTVRRKIFYWPEEEIPGEKVIAPACGSSSALKVASTLTALSTSRSRGSSSGG